MQEEAKLQSIPVKIYRTADRLMIAAPMPGLEPEDIVITVSGSGQLVLEGALRGALKGVANMQMSVTAMVFWSSLSPSVSKVQLPRWCLIRPARIMEYALAIQVMISERANQQLGT